MIRCLAVNSLRCIEIIMSTDSPEFWNETWADIEASGSGSDEILADQVEGLKPGSALELACGLGGNAVWLAKAGWTVTATDYSAVAIEKSRQLASKLPLSIEPANRAFS